MNVKEAKALIIARKLKDAGFNVVFVGGAVRDKLIGREYSDIDIATNARIEDIKRLFETIKAPVGKSFLVNFVNLGGDTFEIASFRKDDDYDGRKPNTVNYGTIKEDAHRRDFTMNGVFYDPFTEKYIDYVDGIPDIKKGIIRFIDSPNKQLTDDVLRILRGLRFHDTLNFEFDSDSFAAIKRHVHKLVNISQDRIRMEIMKTLANGEGIKFFKQMLLTGIDVYIFPELRLLRNIRQPKKYHPEGSVFRHSLLMLKALYKEKPLLKFVGFLHDVGKFTTYKNDKGKISFHGHDEIGSHIISNCMKRLNFSKKQIEFGKYLIANHMYIQQSLKIKRSKFITLMTNEHFDDLIKLHKADSLASLQNDIVDDIYERANNIQAITLTTTNIINGNDLMTVGFREGAHLGRVLNAIKEKYHNNEITNKEQAIEFALNFSEE